MDKVSETAFICEHCGHLIVAVIRGGGLQYSLEAAQREIDRRMRTGEYTDAVQQRHTPTG